MSRGKISVSIIFKAANRFDHSPLSRTNMDCGILIVCTESIGLDNALANIALFPLPFSHESWWTPLDIVGTYIL